MSALTDAWPVIGGAFSFPVICFALYRWVVRQLLEQVKVVTKQRNEADLRAKASQADADARIIEIDAERKKRREAEDIASTVTGITRERDALLAEKAERLRLEGAGS